VFPSVREKDESSQRGAQAEFSQKDGHKGVEYRPDDGDAKKGSTDLGDLAKQSTVHLYVF
jgi:hypothetical protein